MKQNLLSGLTAMSLFVIVFSFQAMIMNNAQAQIYEPEGLNMPGAWDSWTNPPTNLALASSTQVAGGRIVKFSAGQTRWQTIFNVAATGGDLPEGAYEWLFTSGSSANYFQNKWSNVTVVMNTLQTYTKEGPNNNSVTLSDGKWYTVNWEDLGYQDSRAIFMETSAEPVLITAVSLQTGILENQPVNVGITTNAPKSADEKVYLRYTTNVWASSVVMEVPMTGTNGSVNIPGFPAGTNVSCYAFTSTVSSPTADFDLYTIHTLNNMGANYNYTVPGPPGDITWQNLQSPANGEFELYTTFNVFGRAFIEGLTGQSTQAPGLNAWVGFSTENTDPATWTGWSTWTTAQYNGPAGDNDEFIGDLALAISSPGTYYYATRFAYNDGSYVYGGYSATGGGPWDGITNVSGVLTAVNPDAVIDWANLQWPGNGAIETGGSYDVYGQAFIMGLTGQPDPAPGLQAWVGYSTDNTNPVTWTDWISASHNGPAGNNDEFFADLGSILASPGTYYYATRYQLNADPFVFGGFSESGGGFWDGTNNVSGVLTVTDPITNPDFDWVNLQFPGSATIAPGGDLDVYAQAYIEGVTGLATPAEGIEVWIGYSFNNTSPSEWTEWFPASYNAPSGNNDEYMVNLGQNITDMGLYYYASRFSLNGGEYCYGGYSESGGGFWNGALNVSGVLTVSEIQQTFPVLFTIIDGTMLHDAIKLKGEMTSWDTIAMIPDNHVWTLTLDLQPGTYEWGAIEDDGTEFGLWLIEGSNLIMTVGDDGSISGTVTYTTMVTNTQTIPLGSKIYPNPAITALNVKVPGLNRIRLIDMSGRIIREFVSVSDAMRLDLSEVNPGIYQLQINAGKITFNQKVVKL